MESAAALTSARIDLLPHQVVLTHRIATASPRRFLIADEVGLGKTIETALILRELASRGELVRALMAVPAGLVNNWHRELNDVFNLDFEVFGSEGDITDRKTNAFAKHDRLIASIDTLKRPARIKRLLDAPRWDLVVFDEAHHFYERLREYRQDGFDLARRQGNKGRALGFLMAIFQKIAASSFAAVRRTLKRRLLMLTLHEAFLRDKDLDIEGREGLLKEARELIHEEFGIARDAIGRSEVELVLADLKYRLVKKLDEEALEMAADPYGSEYSSTHAEEAASAVVDLHLPEERMRIGDLLRIFPQERETKAQKLLDGLGTLWRQNPDERIWTQRCCCRCRWSRRLSAKESAGS